MRWALRPGAQAVTRWEKGVAYQGNIGGQHYVFRDLKHLLASASPPRSGDDLAGLSAQSAGERIAARVILADVHLSTFLNEVIVPYEEDEVTRLIIDTHDRKPSPSFPI
jgi:ethanolamine ammonia-lyase large subunit